MGGFQAIVSSNTLSALFSLSSPATPIMHLLMSLTASHEFLSLCSLFIFLSAPQTGSFQLFYLQVHGFFCLLNLLLSSYRVFFFSFQLLYLSAPEFPWFFLKILFIDVLLLSIHCFPVFLYLLNLFKTVSLKVLLRKCMSGLPQAFCIFFPLHEPYFLVSLYAF